MNFWIPLFLGGGVKAWETPLIRGRVLNQGEGGSVKDVKRVRSTKIAHEREMRNRGRVQVDSPKSKLSYVTKFKVMI